MPSPAAVIVSDLHLGQGNNCDDFRAPSGAWRDGLFSRFCGEIVDASGGNPLTLILAGDVIDFWEIATEPELDGLRPDRAREAIERNLVFGTGADQVDEASGTAILLDRLDRCHHAHQEVFAALRRLLEGRARLVYLYGNHDHCIVHPELQRAFREMIGGPALGDLLSFGAWYEDPGLRLYVEHGNQLDGEANSYPDILDWRIEAKGYFVLRYVWNRLQQTFGRPAPSVWRMLGMLFSILRRSSNDPETRLAWQGMCDYLWAGEDGRIPRLRSFQMDTVHRLWVRSGRPRDAETFFESRDRELVAEPRAGIVMSERWPGDELYPSLDAPQYTAGLERRFDRQQTPFPKLVPTRQYNLFVGHSHVPAKTFMDATPAREHLYTNTGTWTRDLAHPTYAFVDRPGVDVEGVLREYRG
jgi:UDP-2,3-diacylglucosamine pyrophosphatase LpxH